jgi:malonyl-CoA decarboxylase
MSANPVQFAQKIGGALMRRIQRRDPLESAPLSVLCDLLLADGAPGQALHNASALADRYRRMTPQDKRAFFTLLGEHYGADEARIDLAIAAYQAQRTPAGMGALHAASEPKRQQILRRLNAAAGGTALLVSMRKDALGLARELPDFAALDEDFAHLFTAWFNAGFLTLKRLDLSSSGAVLNRLIEYEAVHEIGSWAELRRRVEPADRRCYAFFHPSMPDDPLIFVEVALTADIPAHIDEVLRSDRPICEPHAARTAVFYSISNCQDGLRGISFGGLLIKRVVDELRAELPGLRRFVTLSPAPRFARWIKDLRADPDSLLSSEDRAALAALDQPGWPDDPGAAARLQGPLTGLAALYLSGSDGGSVTDPVGRFHLGNGARLERVNWLANPSARGMAESHGVMVNYLYDLDEIERNHRAFERTRIGAVAPAVARLARVEQRKSAREAPRPPA